MSWIFGAIGKISEKDITDFKSVHPQPFDTYISKDFYLAVGGLKENCIYETGANCFAVCGTGITSSKDSYRFLSKEDWKRITESDIEKVRALDGHFAGFTYNGKDKVTCFTDALGMGDMFITRHSGYCAFATEAIWLIRLIGGTDFNYSHFGSHWTTLNQLSHESIFHGISRMSTNAIAEITKDGYEIKRKDWMYEKSNNDTSKVYIENLTQAVRFPSDNGYKISLGLSGGLDSRVLLSLLTGLDKSKWEVHTFGSLYDPDITTALDIAKKIGAESKHYYIDKIPDVEESLKMLKDYVELTLCVGQASNILRLTHYDKLHESGKIIIDGGFGEFGRRQFLKRLLYGKKKFVAEGNAREIYFGQVMTRADVFSDETMKLMQESSIENIQRRIDLLPSAKEIGVENWLDLFTLTTRLPNYTGYEQKRMDFHVKNYMPYVQQSVVKHIFNIPVAKKSDNRLYRNIIKRNNPLLAQFPLVKGNSTIPFNTPVVLSLAISKFKSKVLGQTIPPDKDKIRFFDNLKEVIYDLSNSVSAKNYSPYNIVKIRDLVDGYYQKGMLGNLEQLDWWLAFEILRKSVKGEQI